MAKETARQIDEAAALWVVRADRGLTPQEEQELQVWIEEDTRHCGAFGRMQAIAWYTELAAGSRRNSKPKPFRASRAPYFTRRGLTQLGLATLGTTAAAGGIFWAARVQGRYSTQRGQVRVIALADGSVITLNTESTVSIRYSKRYRLVRLFDGEAMFDVAKDVTRPFLVMAGDIEVRALGTSFAIRRLPDAPLQVLVQEGTVEVRKSTPFAPQIVRLSANMRGVVTSAETLATSKVTPVEVQRKLIWREGRIVFDRESLATAAAEFVRYSDTRIVIDDPSLRNEEITGSFQATDPVGFARAAAEALRVRVKVSNGKVRLFR